MKEYIMKKQAVKEQQQAYQEYLDRQKKRDEIIIELPEKKMKKQNKWFKKKQKKEVKEMQVDYPENFLMEEQEK